jgi:hypothetical protein
MSDHNMQATKAISHAEAYATFMQLVEDDKFEAAYEFQQSAKDKIREYAKRRISKESGNQMLNAYGVFAFLKNPSHFSH